MVSVETVLQSEFAERRQMKRQPGWVGTVMEEGRWTDRVQQLA